MGLSSLTSCACAGWLYHKTHQPRQLYEERKIAMPRFKIGDYEFEQHLEFCLWLLENDIIAANDNLSTRGIS